MPKARTKARTCLWQLANVGAKFKPLRGRNDNMAAAAVTGGDRRGEAPLMNLVLVTGQTSGQQVSAQMLPLWTEGEDKQNGP